MKLLYVGFNVNTLRISLWEEDADGLNFLDVVLIAEYSKSYHVLVEIAILNECSIIVTSAILENGFFINRYGEVKTPNERCPCDRCNDFWKKQEIVIGLLNGQYNGYGNNNKIRSERIKLPVHLNSI